MDQDLKGLFGRAVADEPVPLGDIAADAITGGTRIRRRRRVLTGSAAAVALVAVLGAVNLVPRPAPAPEVVQFGLASWSECDVTDQFADEAAIFLEHDATAEQRAALDRSLAADRALRGYFFEDRQAAYQKFVTLWADSPDLVNSVTAEQLPEAFRARLTDRSEWAGFRARYENAPGVDEIIGAVCPEGD
ncbi:permease-like cell division protein FtsX [Catenuloplanes atrovinosus]|uniref:FtsX extracellular domain-containing protein n=1 Tax=Catenuloplanes atrovinosus TaxID=137266 RepID=A0AAE3YWJ4_9ACTN|nr:permease-like cell division protein FtsX [Catenuloplanes atrovinosus]MDR7281045.1 hypothetical protein [Catenuloplanes atrovinosus]